MICNFTAELVCFQLYSGPLTWAYVKKTSGFIVSVLCHQCLSDLYRIDFAGVAFFGHNLLETPALLNKESSKYDIMCFCLSSEDCVDTFYCFRHQKLFLSFLM